MVQAMIIMSKANLVTPRNGEIIIGAIQDFITDDVTGAYHLTHKDTYYTWREAQLMVGLLLSTYGPGQGIQLPHPHILKSCCVQPIPLWSGKQLFGLIIRPNPQCQVKINLETRTKMHSKQERMCPEDSIVVVRNSELLCGYMDKSLLGSGTKKGIFYVLLRDYGEDEAADAMWRLSTWMASYLSRAGFSIGIGDVTPGARLLEEKRKLLIKGYWECENYIERLKNNQLKAMPGFTEEETLESMLLKSLSDLRTAAGDTCFKELPHSNSLRVMAVSGSKGSLLNISQMIALVGQQAISGKRAPDGFLHRTLPHFLPFTKIPQAKGFVENSFYSGLLPTEFFFHTMGGREGLVDTAVKTADTGYMQRRLVKALEDVSCQYDNTIRTCSGEMVQCIFGDDGLNPEFMEGDSSLVDYSRLLAHVKVWYHIL
ncbi:POLR3A [Cordylochernes scorpioides]|uniref:DNA-directed RNA polymerase n=1 Tax=Cordylochernes scorpioides TaxID=51811 RepID=A0ABY6JX19_9ARAC|nr:POLR3A [Cordylochernes scorpioides]